MAPPILVAGECVCGGGETSATGHRPWPADRGRCGYIARCSPRRALPKNPAINQAAQQDRAAVDRLLPTADQLKRAQLGRAPTAVSVAARAYQDAIAALVEESLAHVTGADHATTAAARKRLTGTLMAAATDPALRELLREGRLSREQTVASFDVFGDAPPGVRVVERSATSRADRLQASTPPPPEDRLPGSSRPSCTERPGNPLYSGMSPPTSEGRSGVNRLGASVPVSSGVDTLGTATPTAAHTSAPRAPSGRHTPRNSVGEFNEAAPSSGPPPSR